LSCVKPFVGVFLKFLSHAIDCHYRIAISSGIMHGWGGGGSTSDGLRELVMETVGASQQANQHVGWKAFAHSLSVANVFSAKGRYFGWLVLLTVIDGLQTSHIVSQFGHIAEANPLMRLVMEHSSISGLWWIKATAILAVFLALRRIRPRILLVLIALVASVVTSNLVQMLMVLTATR